MHSKPSTWALPAVLGWERKKGADNGNSAGKRTRNGQGLFGKEKRRRQWTSNSLVEPV